VGGDILKKAAVGREGLSLNERVERRPDSALPGTS